MRLAITIGFLVFAACGKKAVPDYEKQFQEMMTGAVLVGHSVGDNRPQLSGEERYEISRVKKLSGDVWMFEARMKVEGHDIPLPIPVTIKFAGDTPVIEVTDLAIPGMGTYTARVVVYRDRYAGTWSGSGHGGQLFGAIGHGK